MKAILAREPVGGLSLIFGDCNTPKIELPAEQAHRLRLQEPELGLALPHCCLGADGSTYHIQAPKQC